MSEPPGAAVSVTDAPPQTDAPAKPLAAQFVHGLVTNPPSEVLGKPRHARTRDFLRKVL
ncbi:hypothetical protein [Streptomyces griseorubiginosus]|uniref:hypothetical protein n=1 Tax=Streptomyces griseorubiginosus TaxID=67304 RepID=UPI002E80B8E8|nr:hypothetical protein [Streptomyces griseorubiginosus]WUB42816.1 hypothetical protein OHN19_05515 [Streptomyces griseorubiginosus]WUB51335.1 hypothetical protein OG942_05510 [Streptomyces griseorubiginosus]